MPRAPTPTRLEMNSYVLLGISILIGVVGQMTLKEGAGRPSLLSAVPVNPVVALGLFAYFISALFYLAALKTIPLSVAFPSVSASYVLVAFLAHILYKEPFGGRQLAALGLIGSGIIVLSQGAG